MHRSGLFIALVALMGCSDDIQSDLPQSPQVFPNPAAGFFVFPLTGATKSEVADIVFLNGGQNDLVFSTMTLSGSGAFSIAAIAEESLTVISRESVAATVTFMSPGRGVFRATLDAASNAENFPDLSFELIGLGAEDGFDLTVNREPDIEVRVTSGTFSAAVNATENAPLSPG